MVRLIVLDNVFHQYVVLFFERFYAAPVRNNEKAERAWKQELADCIDNFRQPMKRNLFFEIFNISKSGENFYLS